MKCFDLRLAALFLGALGVGSSTQAQSAPQTQPSGGTPAASVVVVATADAFWSADQYAKTAGYVSDVKHDIGDHVSKGDLLAVIYVPELEKNLVQAKAGLAARQQMKKAADATVAQANQALAVAKSQ